MDQGLTREELVRICAHEALRLFSDRLVEDEEIQWCSDKIDEVARQLFAAIDHDEVLERPLFYSSWLTKDTRRVNRDELKTFLSARLKIDTCYHIQGTASSISTKIYVESCVVLVWMERRYVSSSTKAMCLEAASSRP